MTSDFEELGPKGCPYLGLEEDRTVMLLDPSPLHRCFANPSDIQAPTVQHQSGFCLTETHVGCPLYQRAKPQALSAKAKGNGRGGRPNAENSRSGAYVAAGALGLLLVLGGGWLALQFFRRSKRGAAGSGVGAEPAAGGNQHGVRAWNPGKYARGGKRGSDYCAAGHGDNKHGHRGGE
ncbi:MAG: hypothetical protein IPK16_11095 [Anaerolineales bacterium]|nr:hypothetical protein [Anaerolineales bacterium]